MNAKECHESKRHFAHFWSAHKRVEFVINIAKKRVDI